MTYPINIINPWYHGTNLQLDILTEGSTVTQWKELAEAFATKPSRLEYGEIFSPIVHNGTEKGMLYIVDEPVRLDIDIYQHPRSAMNGGVELLTKRPLRLKRIK